MSEIYFLVKHTPFWAVPFMVIGGEFGYLFWLKKKKKSATVFLSLALLGLCATSFYIWAGGPDKSVNFVKKTYREFQQ